MPDDRYVDGFLCVVCPVPLSKQAAHKLMAKGMKPETATYQFKIKGILPNTWTEWFDWFEIKHELGRQRLITGDVIDQT